MCSISPKKQMTEEDIKLQIITPVITASWNFAKDDRVTITSHEFDLSLYQQLAGNDGETDAGEDPVVQFAFLVQKDFLDLIILDECHCGLAKKDRNWRKIP